MPNVGKIGMFVPSTNKKVVHFKLLGPMACIRARKVSGWNVSGVLHRRCWYLFNPPSFSCFLVPGSKTVWDDQCNPGSDVGLGLVICCRNNMEKDAP